MKRELQRNFLCIPTIIAIMAEEKKDNNNNNRINRIIPNNSVNLLFTGPNMDRASINSNNLIEEDIDNNNQSSYVKKFSLHFFFCFNFLIDYIFCFYYNRCY